MSLNRKRRTNEPVDHNFNKCKRSYPSQTDCSHLEHSQLYGTLPQCGIILRISLKNFMCHSNLVVNFNKRVNFLVGCNGSGKSAIMAAVVLGLGSRANATNRSSNMKSFIKNGETSAKIEISLCNEGPSSFESETYGDTIIIVRTITTTAATLVIKNANGTIISKKASDLHRILLYHNIQADNPVFILNQDSAREFLKELDPKKNYKLFLKATQVEMITEKLNDCYHAYVEQKENLKWLEEKNVQLQNEIEQLKEKYTRLMSVAKLRNVLKQKEIDLNWAIVIGIEKDIAELTAAIRNVEQKQQELLASLKDSEKIEETLRSHINELGNELQEKRSFASQKEADLKATQSCYAYVSDKLNQIELELKSLQKKFSFIEDQMNQLKINIEERAKSEVNVEQLREENKNKLENLYKQKGELNAVIESAKRDIKIYLDNKIRSEEVLNELKMRQEDARREYQRIQSQIQNITNSSKDKLSLYGPNVSKLIDAINQYYKAGKFCELPRGPVGRYIEVTNSKYRDVVESQIGGLLRVFITDNKKDRMVLEQIIKTTCPHFQPPIITMKFMKRVYDVSRGMCQPQPGAFLLMDLIKCTDPVVMNCLIDRVGVEAILIAENKEIAEFLTSERVNVPKRLKKVILPNPGLEYFPEPNYRMYSLRIRPAQFIQVNMEERIKQLQQEMTKYSSLNEQHMAEMHEIYPKLKAEQQRIEEKRSLLEQHENAKRKIKEEIIVLENFEYPDHNEVEILKNELDEMNIKYNDILAKIKDKKEHCNTLTMKANLQKNQVDSAKQSVSEAYNELERLREKINEKKSELNSLLGDRENNQKKVDSFVDKISALQKLKDEKSQKLKKSIEVAEAKGPRVEPEATIEEISDAIKLIRSKITKREKLTDNPKDVELLIISKSSDLKKSTQLHTSIRESLHMLNNSRTQRFRYLSHLKKHLAFIVQFKFDDILKVRKFIGSILVDHQKQELTVLVKPGTQNIENAVCSTKSLSGGERSYSTVAFLLSLWSCIDHPFYFLDEYDVFTDEINRAFMTRLLLDEAQKKSNRQYLFLTPQDIAIESKDWIKIHKLAEPKR